jgi:hypothetical protein
MRFSEDTIFSWNIEALRGVESSQIPELRALDLESCFVQVR